MSGLSKFLAFVCAILGALAITATIFCSQEATRADKAEAQVADLKRDAEIAKAIAQVRADAATQALDVATAAASANHKQATTYLQLPTPAPADRCAAAQALVDEAIQKERQ